MAFEIRQGFDTCRVMAGAFAVLCGLASPALAQDRGEGGTREEDPSRERLIRRLQGDEADDIMVRIVQRMDEARQRLLDLFDVGPQTQQVQADILKELDLAIKQAQRNVRRISAAGGQKGDQRKAGQATDNSDAAGRSGQAEDSPDDDGTGGDDVETPTSGALREHKRQWGHLPQRDREEILQGINEDVNEKYREQVDQYYEALAEPEEEEIEH